MRKRIVLIAGSLAVAVAAAATAAAQQPTPSATAAAAALPGCAPASLHLVSSGRLTIGTDNPAYPPWFGGGVPSGSKWKINDPSTGKGYESAVAYATARKLGFARSQVKWTYVPFN